MKKSGKCFSRGQKSRGKVSSPPLKFGHFSPTFFPDKVFGAVKGSLTWSIVKLAKLSKKSVYMVRRINLVFIRIQDLGSYIFSKYHFMDVWITRLET